MIREMIELRGEKVLVFGAGGGGDALGALIVWKKLRDYGVDAVLGSVVWERYQIDPFPGPIPVEFLVDAEIVGRTLAIVTENTVAYRYGSEVKPQIARIAPYAGGKTVFIDLSKGAEGVAEALEVAQEELGFTAFIGVDTGGDILAKGCESDLWSPLADSLSLYAMREISNESISLIAVLSPGADGELDEATVLRYISEVAEKQGLIEVFGLNKILYDYALQAAEHVISEASRIPLRAFIGEYGIFPIRQGTRKVKITPAQAAGYLLESVKVAERSALPDLVAGTKGISQASQALNKACIVTELDLEMELNRLKEHGSRYKMSVVDVKENLRLQLHRRKCEPVEC